MGKLIRLDKFLCDMGLGTRSEVKALIKKKKIILNGEIAKKDNVKLDIETDIVEYEGKRLEYIQFEYYMLNKPAGVVSATKDEEDRTVIDLIDDNIKDLFPVGRLDKDTEGLLLLTNDGALAHNLLSPKKHVDKKYYAHIEGIVESKHIDMFKKGLNINNEYTTKEAKLEMVDTDIETNISKVYVTITEGKYHQVKRMFKAIGMKVIYLKRISMGRLELDKSLAVGEYRKLSEEEVDLLKNNN